MVSGLALGDERYLAFCLSQYWSASPKRLISDYQIISISLYCSGIAPRVRREGDRQRYFFKLKNILCLLLIIIYIYTSIICMITYILHLYACRKDKYKPPRFHLLFAKQKNHPLEQQHFVFVNYVILFSFWGIMSFNSAVSCVFFRTTNCCIGSFTSWCESHPLCQVCWVYSIAEYWNCLFFPLSKLLLHLFPGIFLSRSILKTFMIFLESMEPSDRSECMLGFDCWPHILFFHLCLTILP